MGENICIGMSMMTEETSLFNIISKEILMKTTHF